MVNSTFRGCFCSRLPAISCWTCAWPTAMCGGGGLSAPWLLCTLNALDFKNVAFSMVIALFKLRKWCWRLLCLCLHCLNLCLCRVLPTCFWCRNFNHIWRSVYLQEAQHQEQLKAEFMLAFYGKLLISKYVHWTFHGSKFSAWLPPPTFHLWPGTDFIHLAKYQAKQRH